MTKEQALFASYIIAEAVNDDDFRAKLQKLFGTWGVANAEAAAKELATEYKFDAPLFSRRD
jgi:hypothetical protein